MLDSKRAICQTEHLLLEKAFFSHNFLPLHFTSFLHHLCCQSEIIKLRADPHLRLISNFRCMQTAFIRRENIRGKRQKELKKKQKQALPCSVVAGMLITLVSTQTLIHLITSTEHVHFLLSCQTKPRVREGQAHW